MALMPIIFTDIVRGTVKTKGDFNPTEDADRLKKAVEGAGTDEDTVAEIIATRTNKQLQEVQRAYQDKYHEGCQVRLFEDFAQPMDWRMRMLISSRMKTTPERDAEYIQWAIQGSGTDEMALLEVFGTRTSEKLKAIYPYFTTKERLRSFLKDDLKAPYEQVFLKYLEWIMDPPLQGALLDDDVKYLEPFTFGHDPFGKFAKLFASRDLQRMQDIIREWEKHAYHPIETAAKYMHHAPTLEQEAILAMISMTKNIHGYFAQRIYDAVHGASTNDTQLIRVITSRCEVDMVQIKEQFREKFGMTLESAVESDTSGYYRRCLLMLITE